MKQLDLLELELRALGDVSFVGFRQRPDAMLVQVLAPEARDAATLRLEVERTCQAHLDRPFVVDTAAPTRNARIRLLEVTVRDEPSPAPQVEVHLAFGSCRVIGRADGDDPSAAASATFQALQRLGASISFRVEAAALFENVVGQGVVLVLTSETDGARYGAASGTTIEQAAARATLHALNRHLSTQTLALASS